MKPVGLIILSIVAVLALTWVIQGNDFFLYKTFAPKYEGVRRDTFEQSKAYQQGMIQELQNMQFEYVQATPEQKTALRSIILHRVADFPEEELPIDLRLFINGLKKEQTSAH